MRHAPCIETQIPFTDGSGRLLDEAFAAAGLEKSETFVTNVVRCHPPGNRASQPHEIANCADHLADELRILHPRLIIGLGHDACLWLEGWTARDYDEWLVTKRSPAATDAHRRSLLLAPHPSWVKKRPKTVRVDFVNTLASALRWAFASVGDT